jgi:hypothetical protein
VYFDFFKAKHTTRYLDAYADTHAFAGRTLRDRVHFNLSVRGIDKAAGQWLVAGQDVVTEEERRYRAPKSSWWPAA